MSSKHWFPFYVGDYLRGTAHFSYGAHGMYLLLLLHYWDNQGPISADPEDLRAVCRCTKHEFSKYSEKILAKFSLINGKYFNGKMDEEIAKSVVLYEKKSAAGRAGVRSRAQQMNKQPQPQPQLPVSSPLPKEKTKAKKMSEKAAAAKAKAKRAEDKQAEANFEIWWKLYPRKKDKKPALKKWMQIRPDFDTLMTALKNQVEKDCNYDPKIRGLQFIKLGGTYLNGENWNDPIELAHEPEPVYTKPEVYDQSHKLYDFDAPVTPAPGINPYEDYTK
jgi:uncharacterized protein YdaU (DUF1376 family)